MALNDNRAMAARLSAFVIWALVSAGVVFWGYRFWAGEIAMPAAAQVVGEGPAPRGDLTRLLGSAPAAPVADDGEAAAPAQSSRFRLVGVVAPRPAAQPQATPRGGVALIAVDGRPPKAYAVGARVDGDLRLTAVTHRSASLGVAAGASGMVLELPPLPPPATGTLPRAVATPDGARPAAMQGPTAVPGAPMRSPAFQAQQPGQGPGGAQSDDDDEEAPAPAPAPNPGGPANRARPGGPLTR